MKKKVQYYTIQETCKIMHISLSTATRGLRALKDKPWTEAVRLRNRRVLIPRKVVDNLSDIHPYIPMKYKKKKAEIKPIKRKSTKR